MATKKYNNREFKATVNGREYEFECYTTSTRHGFCHTAVTYIDGWRESGSTKNSYTNRTWERFCYETVLKRAIGKCAKDDRPTLMDVIIHGTAQAAHDEAAAFVASFSAAFNSLNEDNKQHIRNAFPEGIQSQAQADLAMHGAQMLNALQNLC